MNIIDSCGWLEIFGASPIGEQYRGVLESPHELLVPSVCLLEVARRLFTQYGESVAVDWAAMMAQALVVPLDAVVALDAARLGPAHGLPCADSIIYATALRHAATLWTHDAHFRGLPGVRFIEAPSA